MPSWRRCSTSEHDDTTDNILGSDSVSSAVANMQAGSGITTSTQSFGITPESRRPIAARQKRRFYVLGLAGILIAFAGGFVIGYFLEKNTNDDERTSSPNGNTKRNKCGAGMYNCTDPWLAARNTEHQLVTKLDRKSIENFSRRFSSQPHIAASQRSLDLALEIENLWKGFGFDDVSLPTYEVLLSFPKPNTMNKVGVVVPATGQVIYEIANEKQGNAVPPFLAFSASGVIEGDLVYVNYGTQGDFEELQKHNVSVEGRVAIVRYGKIYRGSKVAIATRWKAIGVLIYPDPADYAPYGTYYPDSWFLPPNATQRGSILPGPSFGDPLTNGFPATPGIVRKDRDKVNLPTIPAHVLTYGQAIHFLKRMRGPEVPSLWRGKLNITYRFGPGFQNLTTKVRLNITTENVLKNITNVIGTITGSVEPDRIVLIGAHRDAWVNGAVDAVSGVSVIMELSRVLGVLLTSGWRPRRTIKFCSWAAEEHALIGSTEWVEENYKMLGERAVAYLNLDLAVNGNFSMRTFSSPLLNDLIRESLRNVDDPTAAETGRSVYEVMSEREPSAEGSPRLGTLGTISDYASFYQYLAIPCIDWGYYFNDKKAKVPFYPVYHSLAETFDWVTRFIDPDFKIHLSVAQLGARFLAQLADSPLLPMTSISNYTSVLQRSYDVLHTRALIPKESLVPLGEAIKSFGEQASRLEEYLKNYQNETDFVKLRILNDQMLQIEKSFLYPDGLPGRNEFKHIIFAPSLYNTYASASFPGITDALFLCQQRNMTNCRETDLHISVAINTIRQATEMLKPVV